MLALFAFTYQTTFNNGHQIQTTTTTISLHTLMPYIVIGLVFAVINMVSLWHIFKKAGRPGWAAIIPIYNTWVLAEIAGKPGWWALLMLVPFVNLILSVLLVLSLAENFGKSDIFGIVALWLFSFIGYIMLAFGPSKYQPVQAMEPTV